MYHWTLLLRRRDVYNDMETLFRVIAEGGGLDPRVALATDAAGNTAFRQFGLIPHLAKFWLEREPRLRRRELWSHVCDADRNCTPLLLACRYNEDHGDRAEPLVHLTSNTMLNVVSRCGYTALTAAIESGKTRTVAALLQRLLPCPLTGNDDHVGLCLDPQTQTHATTASLPAPGDASTSLEQASAAVPMSCAEAMQHGVVVGMENMERYLVEMRHEPAIRQQSVRRAKRARSWIAQALVLARDAALLHHATLLAAVCSVLPNVPRPLSSLICAHLFHTPSPHLSPTPPTTTTPSTSPCLLHPTPTTTATPP